MSSTYKRRELKKRLVQYKGNSCEICGYNKCLRALQFHHIDAQEKEFSISRTGFSFEKAKKEVDKCVLLCSNCHTEIHEILDNVKRNAT